MGDLLGEHDALASKTILYRCSDFQKPVAGFIRHQVVLSERYEENEGSVNEFDAHSCKTKAE